MVENNHDVGLVIGGSDAMVEASVVRDTQPRAADLSLGDGINVAPLSGFDASMVLRSSLIERNHRIGVMVAGAHLDMEATLVRDTLPQASDGAFGVGVQVQPTFDSVQPSSLDMRWSRIERSQDTALAIFGSTATVDGTAIVSTAGNPLTGLFGDGIAVSADAESCFDTMCSASAIVTDSLVEQSQRVGVAAFGAEVSLNHMTLACNTIQLNGERDFLIRDDGGNVCTCDGVVTECKVLSAGLTPPPPLDRSGL